MGLIPRCKKCKGKGTNFGIIAASKEHRENEKECSRCKRWLPKNTEVFGIDKARKDGLNPACKDCLAKDREKRKEKIDRQQRTYRINNHERLLDRDRRRQARDRDKRNAGSRQSYRRHREKRLAYQQRYRVLYPENYRASNHKTYVAHKEQYVANAAARRVRKLAVAGRYTNAQIQEQLKRQKYRCYYAACGHAKFEKKHGKYVFHVEHTYPLIRVAGTDIPANDMSYLVLACPTCNLSKGDKFPWEWPAGGRLL